MKKLMMFSLSGLLLLATGCKKNVDTTPGYIPVDPEVLNYLRFSPGDYFIYKDSATGTEDSVVVKESSINKVFVPANTVTRSNWPFAGTSNTTLAAMYFDSLTLHLSNETANPQQDWLFISHRQNHTLNGYLTSDRVTKESGGPAFWYPAVTTWYPSNDNQGGYIIPSIDMEGRTYENVLRFVYSNGIDPTAQSYVKTDYFWARRIGVIKRTITTANGQQTSILVRNGQ